MNAVPPLPIAFCRNAGASIQDGFFSSATLVNAGAVASLFELAVNYIESQECNFSSSANRHQPLFLSRSLGSVAINPSTIFCKYITDHNNKVLDHSCDGEGGETPTATATPKLAKMDGPFSYVEDRYLYKEVKCISLELPEGKILYAQELAPFVQKVIESKPARNLLNQALAAGPLTILLGEKWNVPSGGSWMPKEREIRIQDAESPERKLGHLLFENVNALQVKEQLKFETECDSGLVAKEAFVERWERIEYEVAKIFTSAVLECISKNNWPKKSDMDLPLIFSNPRNGKLFGRW